MTSNTAVTLAIGRKGVKKNWKLINRLLTEGVMVKVTE